MELAMFKEFLICGLGMVVDLSGSHHLHSQTQTVTANDAIASDWKRVGNTLKFSIAVERPKIEAEAAKQLQLKLLTFA
jgi:hypothetical protein